MLKEKGVCPFNEGPAPGPRVQSLPSHSQLSQGRPGGSGTDSGSAVGRSPGSAEQELLACQNPGLRALLEEVDTEEAGEHPSGCWGKSEAAGGNPEALWGQPGEESGKGA